MEQEVRSVADLLDFVIRSGWLFLVAFLLVYLMTRFLATSRDHWLIEYPRKSALTALVALAACLAVLTLILVSAQSNETGADPTRTYGPEDVAGTLTLGLLISLPVIIAMRFRRESARSAGFTTVSLGPSILVGLAVSIIALLSYRDFVWSTVRVNGNHLWALVYYIPVSISEELIYRGYVQTRLIAWIGKWHGWILASLVMALTHIGVRFMWEGYTVPEALLSSIGLIPISLLLGYVMLRTGNLVAPILLHTAVNWAQVVTDISNGV